MLGELGARAINEAGSKAMSGAGRKYRVLDGETEGLHLQGHVD